MAFSDVTNRLQATALDVLERLVEATAVDRVRSDAVRGKAAGRASSARVMLP